MDGKTLDTDGKCIEEICLGFLKDNKCTPCMEYCKSCESANDCSECEPNYFLMKNDDDSVLCVA